MTPIFLTGRFRSGTTLLWHIYDSLPGYAAYYEPLHDNLQAHILYTLPMAAHRGVNSYWEEYKKIKTQLNQWHRPEFGFHRLVLEAENDYPELQAYIQFLIRNANDRRPVLKFNRIDFRLPWIRRNFPNAKLVNIVRDPRNCWVSSRRHLDKMHWDDPYYMDAYDLLLWMVSLEEAFPFLTEPAPKHSYEPHYFIWKLSTLMGERNCHSTVSFDKEIQKADRRGLQKLISAGCLAKEELNAAGSRIQSLDQQEWREMVREDLFEKIEARCLQVLEELGLLADFGKKPLGKIKQANKKAWEKYQPAGKTRAAHALMKAFSSQRSEITRLLWKVRN